MHFWEKRACCYNMAESVTGIEMDCLERDKERKDFENKLIEKIQYGDADEISGITPKDLKECKSNALFMAMKMNFELRRRANGKGPDEEELNKLSHSMDAFTSSLLNPLKSNTESRRILADSLDDVMETAIELEQKKLLAHPVLYSLMNDKWLGESRESRESLRRNKNCWKWLFLNIWCLFDLVLFPFLFPILYLIHRVRDKARETKKRGIVFVINATSEVAGLAFRQMQDTIKFVINKYNLEHVKFHVITKGEDKIHFDSNFSDPAALEESVEELEGGREGIPALHKDLEKAVLALKNKCLSNSKKVLIVLTDHRTCERKEKKRVKEKVEEIKAMPVKLLPIAIGRNVNLRELQKINNGREVPMFGEYDDPEKIGMKIIHEIEGRDLYDRYLKNFVTPYFIFVRDTLSYLALLGLHFVICLAPSQIPFSGVEWAIFVFFMGRMAMEGKQLIRTSMIRGHKGSVVLWELNTYFSDCWKIMDTTAIAIYLTTFILRMVTWASSGPVTDNRVLVIAGYLYGLNTMILTLRAFGHVMETTKRVGAIQIALFHIIGDVVTIFWQFIATILAFSLAATKVYMSEQSYVMKNESGKDLACSTSGIYCWWSLLKHLLWSLLGQVDLDPLDSVDSPSVILAYFLYAVFLIMAVILLINMMIALLSNTYQQVADHSLMEWSYKKAITIQVYSAYDPIPVPLNLISYCFMAFCYLGKCTRSNTPSKKERLKALDAVVEDLYRTYLATYGYVFPLTEKLDQVLQETQRSRQMTNQITQRIFSGHGCQQEVLPIGEKAWQSMGIRVEGCLLTCEGAEACPTCKDDPTECHGARYLTPFSPEHPHFEVLIQESGEKRFLAVGIVWEDYGCHVMPGWQHGTVGYHVDDGKIFDARNERKGKEIKEAMAFRGDLIGCTVQFDSAAEGKVLVAFTLNGKQITHDEISIHNPDRKPLFPYIGMAHKGIRVLAKMNYSDGSNRANACILEASGQEGQKMIKSTLRGLDEIDKTFQANVTNVSKEIFDICSELDVAGQEFSFLESQICSQLNINLHKRPFPANSSVKDSQSLSSISSNLQQQSRYENELSTTDLLRKIEEKVHWLGNTTSENLASVLKTLRVVKEDNAKHTRALSDLRKELEKEMKISAIWRK
ncbi:uncharacterized protein LOC144655919 isoform X2 [Oculina patagonica]